MVVVTHARVVDAADFGVCQDLEPQAVPPGVEGLAALEAAGECFQVGELVDEGEEIGEQGAEAGLEVVLAGATKC